MNPPREPQLDPQLPPQATGLARVFWIVLGCTCVAVGGVGVVLPGLPTTPFLILAAASFIRSSRTLHEKLLGHRVFGPLLREYQENGTVPARAKWWALGMMAVFATFAVVWGIPAQLWPVKLLVAAAALFGAWFVGRLPTSSQDPEA